MVPKFVVVAAAAAAAAASAFVLFFFYTGLVKVTNLITWEFV